MRITNATNSLNNAAHIGGITLPALVLHDFYLFTFTPLCWTGNRTAANIISRFYRHRNNALHLSTDIKYCIFFFTSILIILIIIQLFTYFSMSFSIFSGEVVHSNSSFNWINFRFNLLLLLRFNLRLLVIQVIKGDHSLFNFCIKNVGNLTLPLTDEKKN